MKNKLPLIIAVVIGILALLAINSYQKQRDREINERFKGKLVIVAKTDIAAGTELTKQLVTYKEVPTRFILRQHILAADEALVVGRKTRFQLRAGEDIVTSVLAREERGGLANIIPAGEGAYTVTISQGIRPGLIQVGDHIDIIGSFAVPKPNQPLPATTATWRQGSDIVNIVLLQNVAVLAVGNVFGDTGRPEGASGGDLTLSLVLPEAQLLMFASKQGELGALLRREGESTIRPREDLPRVTFERIEEIIGDLDGKRNYRNVEIIKGSKTTTVPVANPAPEKGQKP